MVGHHVFFGNMRIKSLSKFTQDLPKGFYVMNLIPNSLTDFEIKSGWKLLFDGETSKGWRGAYKDSFPAKGWEIQDGLITVLAQKVKKGQWR